MSKIRFLAASVFLGLGFAGASCAQDHRPDAPLDENGRKQVIASLSRQLEANYVFPDVAKRLSAALDDKLGKGGYANDTTARAFGDDVSRDLRAWGKDGHFMVGYDPDFHAPANPEAVPGKAELDQQRQEVANMGFGIQRVERLPGNVGYLEVRGFGPAEMVSPAFASAMKLLSGTDALILDLRRNNGGEPDSVAFLLSHFFAEGDLRHLNDIYMRRDDSTRQYWTQPGVGTHYARPVYVLTSARTFSGGEECAYDLQTQKRATLVGETTGGGANPGDPVELGHGFAAFIPNGRSINPVTHTNWEHVGVKPDIAVPAPQAQQTAYVAILRKLLADAKEPEIRDDLAHVLANAEKGVADPPVYTMRK